MNYKDININDIYYSRNNILYKNDKLEIVFPAMATLAGIEKNFEKYQIKLEINDSEFHNFLRNLEENNKKMCKKLSKYKSNIIKQNDKYYIVLKVPNRYGKYELMIRSERVYLPVSTDIKENTTVICSVSVPYIWNFTTADDIDMSGCMMEVKEIFIV